MGVSPACAGMIPTDMIAVGGLVSEPRMRGDDPRFISLKDRGVM